MKKRFNSTGVCVSRKHYMVDISNKLKQIKELIDNEFYFTINRPRQYGKTTTLNELKKLLKDEYLVISISFEGIGDKVFQDEEEAKYNSPWNIAADFNVDMSFSPQEISTMLEEYSKENSLPMDIENISEELYFFTGGYPFLVSRLCQIIDEKINKDNKKPWTKEDVQKSVKIILEEKNTLFDTLIKNLENNKELYNYIGDIIVRGIEKSFSSYNPIIEIGSIYGYFKNNSGKVAISNKIFEEIIYNYMVSKLENTNSKIDGYNFREAFLEPNGGINIEGILKRFQQFMKEQYSSKDSEFLENHEAGVKQLCDYLDIHGLNKGYLLIFNFNKNKEFKEERINAEGKDIFQVYV